MRTHPLNLAESEAFYKLAKGRIFPKDCYRNIFRAVTSCKDFEKNGYKIAYGYMQSLGNVYVRHCFILNKYGEAIDPTAYCYGDEKKRKYISFYVLKLKDYMRMLEENSYYPDLCSALREQDTEAIQTAFKNGLLFIG